jgi:hypothetical protein
MFLDSESMAVAAAGQWHQPACCGLGDLLWGSYCTWLQTFSVQYLCCAGASAEVRWSGLGPDPVEQGRPIMQSLGSAQC